MAKTGPKRRRRSIAEFKEFVYEPGEGQFFYFCETHRNFMQRKQDLVDTVPELQENCDYPSCHLDAGYVFFPNLVTVLKRNK
jgi:hypothetical protein